MLSVLLMIAFKAVREASLAKAKKKKEKEKEKEKEKRAGKLLALLRTERSKFGRSSKQETDDVQYQRTLRHRLKFRRLVRKTATRSKF